MGAAGAKKNASKKTTSNPRMYKKGVQGSNKNYINRTQAVKRLQCSLADFRRLCILKGIYPREPKSKKKAQHGSTAPSSLYYVKDIQYLLHEPVLDKLREHKAFAKKLSRALGREQYGLAKNLDASKPTYRLDHIIKERYPSFADAVRDLDDALSLIVLFAHLPSNSLVPPEMIANCSRLFAEWQLYVMRTNALRKVFLSIKGIYYQAQVKGQSVTWIVPYQFAQHVPTDVDFRIMLTFLELYQTLLGFIFYKLYSDENLVYPPKLDINKDNDAAGIGAFSLQETSRTLTIEDHPEQETAQPGRQASAKDVKKQIKNIAKSGTQASVEDAAEEQNGDSMVVDAPPAAPEGAEEDNSTLFKDYYFFLSREVTRPTLEFVIRSFGGQVGWDPTLGLSSPFAENDPRITHHVIDRPLPEDPEALSNVLSARAALGKRAWVQPQWVVDCVNAGSLLPTGRYAPGETLAPHLSPFVDLEKEQRQGRYVPSEALGADGQAQIEGADAGESEPSSSSEEEEEGEEEDAGAEWGGINGDDDEEAQDDEDAASEAATNLAETEAVKAAFPPALVASASNPEDASLRHAAELEAEAQGTSTADFEAQLAKATKVAAKKAKTSAAAAGVGAGANANEPLASTMISGNKTRKAYQHLQKRKQLIANEKQNLEDKKKASVKANKRK